MPSAFEGINTRERDFATSLRIDGSQSTETV